MKALTSRQAFYISLAIMAVFIAFIVFNMRQPAVKPQPKIPTTIQWKAPAQNTIPAGKQSDTIRYGRELLAHTANYLGPKGSVAHISNGMNCQNCHLDGGTRLFANNYSTVFATHPKMNPRAAKVIPLTKRLTECFQRSLNGTAPDTSGKEIKAMIAYMKWLGKGVKKTDVLFGTAVEKLPYLDKAADPLKGKMIFMQKCQTCHGKNGEGMLAADSKSYTNPPLWGQHSYNDGAGMYRIGRLAGFIKNNMPFGATYKAPQLSNEEAWNLAAFINSQPRPHKDQRVDWPDPSKKPVDAPFGPYADNFSEKQHKYGPFKPIVAAQKIKS